MCYWLLLFPALFILIGAERYTFGPNKDVLSNCIENHLRGKNFNFKTKENRKQVADAVSRRFFDRSFERKKFFTTTNTILTEIRDKKTHWFKDSTMPYDLKGALKVALRKCVKPNLQYDLPRFDDELQVLADLLDYILVDWPTSLNEMIRSPGGRSTLRRYAYATGVRLMSALRDFSMDYDRFRRQLRQTWMQRAQKYFHGRSTQFPYIRHRFSVNEDIQNGSITEIVYTIDDVNSFKHRSFFNFTDRNPLIQQKDLYKIINFNHEDSFIYGSRKSNILAEYLRHGISRAQYFIESHINQCYRVLFFILELQASGINTDGDDTYNHGVPFTIVPRDIQEIVWVDEAYHEYLISLRVRLEQYQNECLSSDIEEHLIMLLVQYIMERTSSTTTATTHVPPNYDIGSKKGRVRHRDCGKHYLYHKRLKTTVPTEHRNYGYYMAEEDLNSNRAFTFIVSQNGLYKSVEFSILNYTNPYQVD